MATRGCPTSIGRQFIHLVSLTVPFKTANSYATFTQSKQHLSWHCRCSELRPYSCKVLLQINVCCCPALIASALRMRRFQHVLARLSSYESLSQAPSCHPIRQLLVHSDNLLTYRCCYATTAVAAAHGRCCTLGGNSVAKKA